ncbi:MULTISPECIES: DUF2142 domain-containing protein [unclassified Microbacterium]|uniref:DUF2142 domain-containing protein n=1 Tax=unclassified Microbacterium TaxID=2609290 RepID=UPI00342FB136
MIALSSWAVASPVGGAPDENFHIASIWCGAGDRPGLCETDPDEPGKLVPWGTVGAQCFAFRPDIPASCQDEVLGDDPERLVATEHVNAYAQFYSPVYYAVMSPLASTNVPASVVAIRIVNAAIFVAIASVLFFLLPSRRRPLLVASLAVTLIPWGIYLLASVNPNGWAVLAGGTLWLAVLGFLETTGKRRIALAAVAAVTTVIGAGARSDMAVYAVLGMAAAVVLSGRWKTRDKRFWLSLILPAALSIVCFLLFLSAQQIGIWQNGVAPGSGGSARQGVSLLAYNLLNLPSLWVGSLGTWPLGWNDAAIPPFVWVGTIFVAAAAIFTGLATISWRKALVLGVSGLALIVLPLYLLQRSATEVGGLVHPRYLLPLIIMFVGFALFPVGRRLLRVTTLQVWLAVAILSVANSVAMYSNIRRYTLAGQPGVWLSAPDSWWWEAGVPQPIAVWIIGSLSFAGVLAVLAAVLLAARGRADEVGVGAGPSLEPAATTAPAAATLESSEDPVPASADPNGRNRTDRH